EILDKRSSDPETAKARAGIMSQGIVPKILARQNPDGSWDDPDRFYRAKYKGTVWQLLVLAELGASGNDPRVRKAGEFILENAQDRIGGGFSFQRGVKAGGGLPSGVIPCLTGNLVWGLLRLGFGTDPRLGRAIDWIATYQRFDDAETEAPRGYPYDRYKMCWGRHSCHLGVVKAMKALTEIPESRRSAAVRRSLAEGAEYLLKHHIHKKSHNLSQTAKPGWLRFGFPLMYQSDILEILGILLKLGYKDPRMQEAVDIVVAGQDGRGTWILANTMNGRFWVDIEKKGKPSKWITVRAVSVLKKYYS
ncbi:MAG: prenyltransferase/squalene oxidase repeat-containing protein, partial [Candidatus Aminicenantales bacterium]